MEAEVFVWAPDPGQSSPGSLLSCTSSCHPPWQGPGFLLCVEPAPSSQRDTGSPMGTNTRNGEGKERWMEGGKKEGRN